VPTSNSYSFNLNLDFSSPPSPLAMKSYTGRALFSRVYFKPNFWVKHRNKMADRCSMHRFGISSVALLGKYFPNSGVQWPTLSIAQDEVFTAVTMNNGVFWDVTPCGPCKNRRFGRLRASFMRVRNTEVFLRSVRRLLVTASVVPM
jgi:hypothetical protein